MPSANAFGIDPATPIRLEAVGRAAAPVVADFPAWVHRRVTAFDLEAAEFARMHESIDFTLPRRTFEALTIPQVGTFVPIGFLRRGPMQAFDLRRQAQAVSLATAQQTVALVSGIAQALGARGGRQLGEALAALAVDIERAADADERTRVLQLWRVRFGIERGSLPTNVLRPDAQQVQAARRWWPEVAAFFDTLLVSFVAFAVLPSMPEGRTVIKHAYDVDIGGLNAIGFGGKVRLPIPGALLAGSHHVDVALAEDLRAPVVRIIDTKSGERLEAFEAQWNVDRYAEYGRRDAFGDSDPAVAFVALAEPRVYALPAACIAFLLLALLLVGWFADPAEPPPRSTVVLLAASGLLGALLQRTPSAAIARRLVLLPRLALGLAGFAVLSASAVLAMGGSTAMTHVVWAAAAALAVASVLVLLTVVALGSPRERDGNLEHAPALLTGVAVGSLSGLGIASLAFNPVFDLTPVWTYDVAATVFAILAMLNSSRATFRFLVGDLGAT